MRSAFGLPPSTAIFFLLLSAFTDGVSACMIDPLAPVGWVYSGIKQAALGVKTVVVGTAQVTHGAYRLANPTDPPVAHVSATASEPPKSGFAPKGCFRDKEGKPDLPFIGGTGRKMNKERCSIKCQLFGVAYFGLQTNVEEKGTLKCWCGNFFGLYGRGTDYDCVNRCPGEEGQSKELCGGEGYNSVYEIKRA